MLIKFWIGICSAIAIGILIMIILGWITKRRGKGSGPGAIIGFFLGVAVLFAIALSPKRAYVVTGDEIYVHYMVFGTPEYEMESGEIVKLEMSYNECIVINETADPVVVEEAVYGGYGFGGDTDWVYPGTYETMNDHRIFYFFDDEPPSEISVKDDSEETVRLWLRKKRD